MNPFICTLNMANPDLMFPESGSRSVTRHQTRLLNVEVETRTWLMQTDFTDSLLRHQKAATALLKILKCRSEFCNMLECVQIKAADLPSTVSLDESWRVCRDGECPIAAVLPQHKKAVTTVEFLSVDNPEIKQLISSSSSRIKTFIWIKAKGLVLNTHTVRTLEQTWII